MNLTTRFGRTKESEQLAEPAIEPAQRSARTHSWTGGPALASKLAGAGIAVALLTGPAALALAVFNRGVSPVSAAARQQVDLGVATAAGERAVELTETWLAATRSDDDLLKSLYSGSTPALPDVAAPSRNVRLANVVDQGAGVWAVSVGADVRGPQLAGPWVRRYYQVPVLAEGTGAAIAVRVLALPAPVAGPKTADAPELQYTAAIETNGPLGQAVEEFLGALTTGHGDITRYISPGANISAITPAPYEAVTVRAIEATTGLDDAQSPSDGRSADVLVTVELTRADGQSTSAQYVLELVARATRWEVRELALSPATVAVEANQTANQGPTSTPTEGKTDE